MHSVKKCSKKRPIFETFLYRGILLKVLFYFSICLLGTFSGELFSGIFSSKIGPFLNDLSLCANVVDGFCKDLMNCYKCVGMDHDDENLVGICDSTEEDYKGPSLIRVQQVGTLQACSEENADDPCKTRVCSCDTNFVYNLMQAFFGGTVFDLSPQHVGAGGNFDTELECPKAGYVAISKSCCGIYWKVVKIVYIFYFRAILTDFSK